MSVNSLQACVLSRGRAGASDALPGSCSSRGPSRQGPCLCAGGFHPGIRALPAPTLLACLGILFMSFASAVLVCFAHLRQSARENRPSGLSQTDLSPPLDPSRSRFPKARTKPYRLVDVPSSRSATNPKPDALSLAYIYVTATALHSRTATKPSSRRIQPPFRHPSPRAPRNLSLTKDRHCPRPHLAPLAPKTPATRSALHRGSTACNCDHSKAPPAATKKVSCLVEGESGSDFQRLEIRGSHILEAAQQAW